MNVLAAVIPQIKAYVVRGSETGDVSRDDVNRDRFPREGCPKQSVLTETEDLLMKTLERKKKRRVKRPQHRNLRSNFLVYYRRMWIIVCSVPSLQMEAPKSLKKT